jgi:hypothetical protein
MKLNKNTPRKRLKIISPSFKKVNEIRQILYNLLCQKHKLSENLKNYNKNFKELKKIANEIRVRTLIVKYTLNI